MVTDKREMLDYLKRVYGVETEEDLYAALEKVEPLDIGIFVTERRNDGIGRNQRGCEHSGL